MSVLEKILVEVLLDGKIVQTHFTCSAPSVGTEFILGDAPGARIVKARRILWNHDSRDIYSVWVQVVCDDTGETV